MGDLARVQARVAAALEELEELFVPGVRLTFVARHPDQEGAHVIVTADDLGKVAALLEAEKDREPDPTPDPREQLRALVHATFGGGGDRG